MLTGVQQFFNRCSEKDILNKGSFVLHDLHIVCMTRCVERQVMQSMPGVV